MCAQRKLDCIACLDAHVITYSPLDTGHLAVRHRHMLFFSHQSHTCVCCRDFAILGIASFEKGLCITIAASHTTHHVGCGSSTGHASGRAPKADWGFIRPRCGWHPASRGARPARRSAAHRTERDGGLGRGKQAEWAMSSQLIYSGLTSVCTHSLLSPRHLPAVHDASNRTRLSPRMVAAPGDLVVLHYAPDRVCGAGAADPLHRGDVGPHICDSVTPC